MAATTLYKKYRPLFLLSLITVHLFLMNGFYPTHRQLTVATYFTSIRNFVDPSLYKNSIYVQAVNRTNLRISLAYDMMPFVLQYIDFETFGIIQGVISIFFVIAGIFRLTVLWFKNEAAGYLAALLYTTLLNEWTLGSPAPYLNFYHHGLPYTYPLIVWSLVFFWQKRYMTAVLLAGIAWNFHPMCTAFLLGAYVLYGFLNFKQFHFRLIFKCFLCFAIPAVPSLVKSFMHMGTGGGSGSLWLEGVAWVADYTCLPSLWPFAWLVRAGLFFILFLICWYHIKDAFLKNWISIFLLSVLIFCLAGTVFADLCPVPLVIKGSFWRSTIIYLFIALPCIAWMISRLCALTGVHKFLGIVLAVLLAGHLPDFTYRYLPFFILLLGYVLCEDSIAAKIHFLKDKLIVVVAAVLLSGFCFANFIGKAILIPALFFACTMGYLLCIWLVQKKGLLQNYLLRAMLFIVLFDCSVLIYNGGPAIYFHGKIKGKVDPWADIQTYARTVSNKDDLFITPPYMNDFSLYSQRATLSDWAEGSTLLYLDNKFTEEWFEHMHALGWTEKRLFYDGYNRLTTREVLDAAKKYNARFVVTEKPKTFNLKKLYENDKFILYNTET